MPPGSPEPAVAVERPEGTPMAVSRVLPGEWPVGFASGRPDRRALLVLAYLEGITPRELHQLAARTGTAAGCLAAVARGKVGSARDRALAAELDVEAVHAAVERCGARHVAPGDPEYPEGLLALPDPPASLFVRGGSLAPWPPAVAVVGARSCTPYGREVAELLGRGLAMEGVMVVSGAARGIDAAAHRGALAVGGPTTAVLGSGIDVDYPRSHRRLIQRIAEAGAVVSEYPPGVLPRPYRFPARNRIVAALARGVVVVEGAPGSGSLITAEFAGDLGGDVMAVPGGVTGPLSAAPNALIRDGAALVRNAADVLDTLRLRKGAATAPDEAAGGAQSSCPLGAAGLGAEEHAVLTHLSGFPATLDEVAAAAEVPPTSALRALAALELGGLVEASGGRYRRTGRPGSPQAGGSQTKEDSRRPKSNP
jgi:DNA processing protein